MRKIDASPQPQGRPHAPSRIRHVVRSISGKPELRRVTEVQEWRIEQELDSSRFVISVVSAGGQAQSFLVALADAQDIGDVLRRKAAGLSAPGG